MAARLNALIDTGPLVGFLDESDQWHDYAVEEFPRVNFPAYTCEAVLSEACYILRANPEAVAAILAMVDSGALVVLPVFPEGASYTREVIQKYSGRTDLADAALLWLAESNAGLSILTTDKKDFSRYRLKTSGRHLRLICPK
jgi:predicted nucleic acid-binding protein